MARYSCPSCGARYNGKRCRSCLYEHFSEEISHGNHTHRGEPLVIDTPVRKPIRRTDPFDCDTKTRKKGKGSFGILLAILLALTGPILDIAAPVISDVSDAFFPAQPEPVMAAPEYGMLLLEEDGLRVVAQWKDGQAYGDGIRIWVENDTGYDLTAAAYDIIVNDYMMDSAYFYCDVRDGSMAMSTLYLDETAMEEAGIQGVADIRFHLEFWEQDSYETIFTSQRIQLTAASSQSTVYPAAPEGTLIYAQDGIRVSFLGYREDEYDPQNMCEGTLLFHIENNTDRYLQVYPQDVCIRGETADVSFWCQLYPNTKAVTAMYLYGLEEMPVNTPEELFPMELTLEFSDRQDDAFRLTSDPVVLTMQ